jgi:hypothetical protein
MTEAKSSFLKKHTSGLILVLLACSYPILKLYGANAGMVQPRDVLEPILLSIGGFLLLYLILSITLFKNGKKTGIFVAYFSLLFFNYGNYQDMFSGEVIPFYPKDIAFDHNFFKWFSLLSLLLLGYLLIKKIRKPRFLYQLLLLVSLGFVALPAVKLTQHIIKAGKQDIPEYKKVASSPAEVRPPIYYIIVDAYANNNILKKYYDFDNSDFLEFLRNSGFYVADSSISNYGQTVLSLPSSMNMMYLDSIADQLGKKNKGRWPMNKLLNQSKLVQELNHQAYYSISFDAPVFEVAFLRNVDKFYLSASGKINLFQNELLNRTAVRAFKKLDTRASDEKYDGHRKRIMDAFKVMNQTVEWDFPFYVHGHILCPHQPFVFKADGSPVNPGYEYNIWSPHSENTDVTYYRKAYIEQLQYVNSQLKRLIDNILKNSKTPPIIIIQGDHGPASELRNVDGFENNAFDERFGILNAYYFPDQDYKQLYPQISPVNSFRVLMNKYFEGQYELLEDKAFYSDWTHPYDFQEVTDQVR